ncbi:hypothetical protein pb186bvf_020427 [Paramecium bursaria]
MNQIFCQESPDDLEKICRAQFKKNSIYVSAFIKLGNQLIKSISQLMLDYKTLDKHFQYKIQQYAMECSNRQYYNDILQNLNQNLRQALIDYQITENSILGQMENLQKEFRSLIQQIDMNHFKSDQQVQIHYETKVKKSIKFKEFQECKYKGSRKEIHTYQDISAAEISPDQTQLVCIAYTTIYIWDYLKNSLIQKHDIKNYIETFTFIYPSNKIIAGNNKGSIYQILNKDDKSWTEEFEVHSNKIYFIFIKNLNEIFTCSKDNTIKLINIQQRQVLQTIDYVCSCRCNFIYVEVENILIVPNGQNLSIFDIQDGLQLQRTHYGEAEMFLQILLSNNYENIYLNLPSKHEIKMYQLDCQAKQIRLTQIIKLTSYCYNISLCFGDDILVILDDAGFQLRHLIDDLPLIKEIQSYGRSMFSFNRQHPKLNKLLSLDHSDIIINERMT